MGIPLGCISEHVGRTEHLEKAIHNRLDLVDHQNERKEAHVDNIKCPHKVFW